MQAPTRHHDALKLSDLILISVFAPFRSAKIILWLAATVLTWLYTVNVASAQTEDRVVTNPPMLEIQQGTLSKSTLLALPAAPRMTNRKALDLNVVYTESSIYNSATGRLDKVRLRSYEGAGTNPTTPYVAPTIEVRPGDTVQITLHNMLPFDPSCIAMGMDPDVPHCFNGTNLHTHGLWVSPTGNSDNVLLSINPGVSFRYEYNIPPDHPAGTFWYHSHRHGSTALQVSSGMAGALIVRGDRLPTSTAHGDIDTLLKSRDGDPVGERILVLQQIQYACLDSSRNIKVQRDDKGKVIAWVCAPGDTGLIEFYADKNGNGFGPGTWKESGRFTSINGIVLPTFRAKAGDIERWRLIHAGVRDTIALQFYRMKPQAESINRLTAIAADQFIADNCTGDPVPYYLIAADGLTMAAAQQVTTATLQPGYRNDALVVFPDAGRYCVVNAAISAPASVSRRAEPRRLLGIVDAAPGTHVLNISNYVVDNLVTAAQRSMPPDVRGAIIADLKSGFRLTNFTAHPDITDAEVEGHQYLTFFIDTSADDAKFEVSSAPFDQPFEPKPYDPNRVDRTLILGSADEWQLQSRFVSHPFHIHVNPFQIVRILDPNGNDVSAPGAVDNADGQPPDPQYPGLKGVWKDTLWVKSLIPSLDAYPKGVYTIVIRSRYERYIGEYVLHCHILDHEDQGMMQNVRVALPDGKGGAAHEH
ncbi:MULTISPECIES: multicopper oxidase family protein [Paraburkholderia]|uniref:multicopper oxidase family protein n=1 Tax=Paraburkholderia TaxID=1822464 RepID=UPI002255DA9A|nr:MULTISPECIES: multicopper oxidase domain-containing protein [Paraburkholderia]MCX4177749.1 multicopper oxidase domain-containing protein [Paraburkholderia madseniana]MDQ6465736.1 multicopper oxidase domain-containing protein [Paraburkholderia madseniana]